MRYCVTCKETVGLQKGPICLAMGAIRNNNNTMNDNNLYKLVQFVTLNKSFITYDQFRLLNQKFVKLQSSNIYQHFYFEENEENNNNNNIPILKYCHEIRFYLLEFTTEKCFNNMKYLFLMTANVKILKILKLSFSSELKSIMIYICIISILRTSYLTLNYLEKEIDPMAKEILELQGFDTTVSLPRNNDNVFTIFNNDIKDLEELKE
ncbi:unnamed protein product [Didymodactylos carnosus]|uniref:Uncharacterized protein n=1 Tax=Didymodactylos carnosus TaxID=1234261 RepID=A0A8S2ERT7_9BILA|nr:unnamed protein product [Didymodactylos carnosus]CAF4045775.1 unnamed protein product [Didymodactylos carnosus]